MIGTFGATAAIAAPTRKRTAQTKSAPRRPSASASLPPRSAPNAAPGKSSELTTTASVTGGQRQVVAHVQQRAGDDAGVVAEEQTAQRGDHGQLDEELVVRRGSPGPTG